MPNGDSRNWIRLQRTLEIFYALYGKWPSTIKVYPFFILELKQRLTNQDFERLSSKINLIADENNPFLAYDEAGNYYDYARCSHKPPEISTRAIDWLDIKGLIEMTDYQRAIIPRRSQN